MSNSAKLGNLVHRKGAPRPGEIPQRGEPVEVELTPAAPAPAVEPAPAAKVPVRALTLKLVEPEYELLRVFAFQRKKSHQDVMRDALLLYIKNESEQ
jgi:hypothetical protein